MMVRNLAPIPLWRKLALTAFVAFLIPYYWHQYGWQNFLWLSDVGLFLTVIALWGRSRLINSMMAIGVLPLELFWNVDFFLHLIADINLGLADYMFDETRPFLLRGVSLFHVILPIIWLTLLRRWGYDSRAFKAQTLLLWIVLVATFLMTNHDENINWVFSPDKMGWRWMPQPAWLAIYMIVVPAALHWPLHKLYMHFQSLKRVENHQ